MVANPLPSPSRRPPLRRRCKQRSQVNAQNAPMRGSGGGGERRLQRQQKRWARRARRALRQPCERVSGGHFPATALRRSRKGPWRLRLRLAGCSRGVWAAANGRPQPQAGARPLVPAQRRSRQLRRCLHAVPRACAARIQGGRQAAAGEGRNLRSRLAAAAAGLAAATAKAAAAAATEGQDESEAARGCGILAEPEGTTRLRCPPSPPPRCRRCCRDGGWVAQQAPAAKHAAERSRCGCRGDAQSVCCAVRCVCATRA